MINDMSEDFAEILNIIILHEYFDTNKIWCSENRHE